MRWRLQTQMTSKGGKDIFSIWDDEQIVIAMCTVVGRLEVRLLNRAAMIYLHLTCGDAAYPSCASFA